ncbi:adenosine kinase [Babesia caballi]|uniref:Adenosine kinase n=1 Tax=Babesia caballi TaxID=5871 RepID=A0AAV4M675_BABCB|nr:adenosine kinase [Babesia caballi]
MNAFFLFTAVFGVVTGCVRASAPAVFSVYATGEEVLETGPSRVLFAGNSLYDIVARVDQSVVDSLKVDEGVSNGITPEASKKLEEQLEVLAKNPGGSAANIARAYCFCGGKGAYFGVHGTDNLGYEFDEFLSSYGVDLEVVHRPDTFTSQLYNLITPDADRSQHFLMGASETISESDIDQSIMDKYDYVAITGFMVGTPHRVAFVDKLVAAAFTRQKKLIIFLSDMMCVRKWGDKLKVLADQATYISGTLEEYSLLYNLEKPDELLDFFVEKTKGEYPEHKAVIMTMGHAGAIVIFQGKIFFVPPTGVDVVDTTGAGDFFAGSMLCGLLNGYSVAQASEFARAVVGDVISKYGTSVSSSVHDKIEQIKQSSYGDLKRAAAEEENNVA